MPLRLLLMILVALVAPPASAQVVGGLEREAPAAISSRTVGTEDRDIAGRIRAIYSEIAGLEAVEVRVSAGVVTLRGSVASPRALSEPDDSGGIPLKRRV